jgi:hypothetical protein
VLLRLAYLTVSNAFAVLRLLPMSDREKDAKILALRHQLAVLQRQLGMEKARFTPSDRIFLAALLHRLPRDVPRRGAAAGAPGYGAALAARPGRPSARRRLPGRNVRAGRGPCAACRPTSRRALA